MVDAGIENIVIRPLRMTLLAKQELERKFYESQSIEIMLPNLNILEFSYNEETKNSIIESGISGVKKYLEGVKKPIRRHSVS
jgi:uncharacterized protein YehS (DUF1456 family)